MNKKRPIWVEKHVKMIKKSVVKHLQTFFSTFYSAGWANERWWWWFEIEINMHQHCWSQFRHLGYNYAGCDVIHHRWKVADKLRWCKIILLSPTTTTASPFVLSLPLRLGAASASPSPLPRDVGPPFSASWGLHAKGGPMKLVFKSPVRSGYGVPNMVTETLTG